ncbi:hypothetical protein B0H16DRAFT_1494257 [Mycena metata]|uniref:F-box domain-containing protein n=1 Tax=Mycena metata TaxID=1033252 RepID=A0AAD7P0I6_9AGAR|nr:hypothetical protein B0H16DRAFT_1494257 [Mycena metata]
MDSDSRLALLATAWQSDDATDLGRAIALYLSNPDGQDADQTSEEESEVTQLKSLNRALQDRMVNIEEELADLRVVNQRQAALIAELTRGRAVFKQPPEEILRIIFDFVIPPSFLVDPSLSYGPDSPWCQSVRAKMVLAEVCWVWYQAAIDVLYENVAFRTVGQVSALLRTLTHQTSVDFGQKIKEIGVYCDVPRGYSTVFRNDLSAIVTRAPRLSSVVLHSPWSLPTPITLKDVSPSAITHLDCGPTVNYFDDIHGHIGHISSTLVFLALHLSKHPVPAAPISIHTLLRLETLRCFCVNAAPGLLSLGQHLILPGLKTFIFEHTLNSPVELGAGLTFCAKHGRPLRTLSFRAGGLTSSLKYDASKASAASLQPILDLCPRLEHLILPGSLASSPDLSHSTVKWIDFWTMFGDSTPSFLTSVALPGFPAVKGIRQIVVSAPLLFGDISTTIPPHLGLEDPFEFDFPGFYLRHGDHRVYRNDALDILGAEYEEDDESDEDYVARSDSDSSSSGDESFDCESCDGQQVEESDWEADHESNLAMYQQLLN